MTYILDTDVFTLAELPDSPEYLNLHARVLQLANDDRIVTTIITYEEQTRGWLSFAARSPARSDIKLRHTLTSRSIFVHICNSTSSTSTPTLRGSSSALSP